MSSNKLRHIICVPDYGHPYLVGSSDTKENDEYLALLQKALGGLIETCPTNDITIHPMFCAENNRWLMVRQMLTSKTTEVYVNEEGLRDKCPNVALIVTPDRRVGGCPHPFGDVCVDVSDKVVKALGFNINAFKLVEACYEPEDEEEQEAKAAECASKGWDYKASSGQIYEAVC